MSSAGTYYTYETNPDGTPVLDANGNKIVETTWTITDETGLFGAKTGNSTVTIKDSSGATIQTLTGVPDGALLQYNIQTGTNASNGSLVSVLGGQWVSTPGSSGTINFLIGLASVPTFTIGGTTDINFAINAATVSTVNIYGGIASFSGGIVAGALAGSNINIGYGGKYDGSTQLVSLLQGTTVNFTTGGGTLVLNGDHKLLNLSGTSITGYDPQYDTIEIDNTVAPVSGYVISGSGTSRTITLQGSDGNDIASYSVTIADGANVPTGTYNNSVNSQDLATNPLKITYENGNTYIGACFLSDSMIRTPEGDVAVQDIQVGDSVVAYVDGQQVVRKVVWAGKTRVAVKAGLPDDEAGYPVRILKDALAEGVPYKDMLVTPEHCLFFNGLFTPVRMLVNGASIFYDHSITSYDYYHIETEQHSVIMADGVMTESYLDTGNRGSFRQEGTVVSLNAGSHKTARTWAEDAAAPLVVAQAVVEPIFRKIEARAKHAGIEAVIPTRVVTNDADVHLVTESGAIIRKAREQNGKVFFMLPPGIDRVWLVSRTSRPADTIGPFVDDRRQLGVLVSNMSLQEGVGAARNLENIMQDADLQGWHDVDAGHSMRWTAGHAEIPLVERTPGALAMLSVQIIAAGPYVLEGEQTEQKVASL
ncbi:Hint domain-containing protein [Acetobacter senegalensis]|uniref:Hint domain-containing protein n=1 Tax=Acetobacter senegalensis TaxID=446692 RepID=UPI001EDAFBD5|nr:Hint domain-containing protein [Acetobacter senegalensis]MCG4260206.1 Hint domain-containing protein [Acetobacter senegalensis]